MWHEAWAPGEPVLIHCVRQVDMSGEWKKWGIELEEGDWSVQEDEISGGRKLSRIFQSISELKFVVHFL